MNLEQRLAAAVSDPKSAGSLLSSKPAIASYYSSPKSDTQFTVSQNVKSEST